MIKYSLFVLIIISFSYSEIENLSFGISLSFADSIFKLTQLHFEPLKKNISKMVSKKDADDLVLKAPTQNSSVKICDIEFSLLFGFKNDSLVLKILTTEEMPYVKKHPKNKCFDKHILKNDTIQHVRIIVKEKAEDGNIFWEGGFNCFAEREDAYVSKIISVGLLSKPSHIQYAYMLIKKEYANDLFNRLKIHKSYKKSFNPTFLFSDYLVNKFKKLQKPMKK